MVFVTEAALGGSVWLHRWNLIYKTKQWAGLVAPEPVSAQQLLNLRGLAKCRPVLILCGLISACCEAENTTLHLCSFT